MKLVTSHDREFMYIRYYMGSAGPSRADGRKAGKSLFCLRTSLIVLRELADFIKFRNDFNDFCRKLLFCLGKTLIFLRELADFIEFLKDFIDVCRKSLFCLRKISIFLRELTDFIEFLKDFHRFLSKIIVLHKENIDFPPRTHGFH